MLTWLWKKQSLYLLLNRIILFRCTRSVSHPVERECSSFKRGICYMSQMVRLATKRHWRLGEARSAKEEVEKGSPAVWSQSRFPQSSAVPGSCLPFPAFPEEVGRTLREYLPQDKSLLSWPRIPVRSNKAAFLLSAKSSVCLPGEVGGSEGQRDAA